MAEPLSDKGGEETGVPGENPWRRTSEILTGTWTFQEEAKQQTQAKETKTTCKVSEVCILKIISVHCVEVKTNSYIPRTDPLVIDHPYIRELMREFEMD